jgi:hexokinase
MSYANPACVKSVVVRSQSVPQGRALSSQSIAQQQQQQQQQNLTKTKKQKSSKCSNQSSTAAAQIHLLLSQFRQASATPLHRLRQLADAMTAEMHSGLMSEGGSEQLKMLPTYVENLPHG